MRKAINTFLIVLVFALGFKAGQNDIIEKQIITNQEHQKGFYEANYKEQLYSYWYERGEKSVSSVFVFIPVLFNFLDV